jgi:MATE family multidrug resistance protein
LAARRVGNLGILLGVGFLSVLVIIPLSFSDQIIRLFISSTDVEFEEVSILAAQFLMIGAIFQVFDGLQAIAARALRAFKDMIAPLWIAGFGYWVLGIGGGSLLASPRVTRCGPLVGARYRVDDDEHPALFTL